MRDAILTDRGRVYDQITVDDDIPELIAYDGDSLAAAIRNPSMAAIPRAILRLGPTAWRFESMWGDKAIYEPAGWRYLSELANTIPFSLDDC